MAKKRTGIETEVEPNPSPKKIKKDLDVKKESRQKRYEDWLKAKKEKEAADKLNSRPPWRPSGRATATRINEKKTATAARDSAASRPPMLRQNAPEVRPVTRSMRKTQSDSNIQTPSLFDLGRGSKIKNRRNTEEKPQCPVIPEPTKKSLPKPICSESATVESSSETEPIKPKPTGFTPMMNRVR